MSFADFWRHTAALTLKETRQIVRDKSAFLLGIVMPVVLIILFGYGLSFDIRDVRLGDCAGSQNRGSAGAHNRFYP